MNIGARTPKIIPMIICIMNFERAKCALGHLEIKKIKSERK